MGSARMYSALMCWSFLTSKNAGDGVTSSRRNCSTISSSGRISTPSRGPPPEQREVVHHRLGEVARGREVGDRDGVLALRELLATLVDEHRQVGEQLRPAEAEGVAEQQVLRGAGHVVLAAHDVGDAHLGVVEHVREQEHRHAGRSQEHEVLDGLVLEAAPRRGRVSVNDVVPVVGDAEPQRRGRALARDPGPGSGRRSRAGHRAPWPGPGSARRCSRTSRPGRRRAGSAPPRGASRGCRPGTRCRRPNRGPASAARRGCSPPAPSSSARGRCPRPAGASPHRCASPPAS